VISGKKNKGVFKVGGKEGKCIVRGERWWKEGRGERSESW